MPVGLTRPTPRSRGRPSKVIKPHRSGRPSPAFREAALEHLHGPSSTTEGEEEGEADLDADADEQNDQTDPNQHPRHRQQQQQLQHLSAAATYLSNGPAIDPSIHPDLQALSNASHAPPFAGMEHAPPAPMEITQTAEELARESGYGEQLNLDNAASTLSKRLAPQPGVRHAVQRRLDQQLNLARRSNVEALLAHVSGQEAASSCKNCHKGHGPWTVCVVVDGQMCGSCANCWYNASGARCSFHDVNNPQAHRPAIRPGQPAGTQSSSEPLSAVSPSQGVGLQQLGDDPVVSSVVEEAMNTVRTATKRDRYLMKVKAAAIQLSASVAEYREFMQTPEGQLIRHNEMASRTPISGLHSQGIGNAREPPEASMGDAGD